MTGVCRQHNPFRGIVTVSEKGQLVIPSFLREELKINRGDRLIVLKRKDGQGLTLLKEGVLQATMVKLTED